MSANTSVRRGRRGDPALLQQQAATIVEVRNNLSRIQHLTADNASQLAGVQKLAALTERRIALMDQAMKLKRAGQSSLEAQAPITREIIAVANETDGILHAMDDEEERLLVERQKREAGSFWVIAGTLLTSLFFALVLFLVHHKLLTDEVWERVRAERAQRTLSARLLTVQDEERRKFARELHDSVGQQLAAMKMAVSMLESKLPGDPIIEDCLKLLDDSIAETRTISHLLHPPLLDEAGLNSAIRWFVEGFAKRSGIEVDVHIRDSAGRFDRTVELVLFRALQESLTNVHRHSGAKKADVDLTCSEDEVILSVKDNGCGMPSDVLRNLSEAGSGSGVGLAGMTERVREIGGRIVIKSDNRGTEIAAFVPVRWREPQTEILPTQQEPQKVAG